MTSNSIPEPWLSFLSEIDAALEGETHFHCFGGFAIAMLYGLERTTADIDIVSGVIGDKSSLLIDLAGRGSALHKRHKVNIDPVGTLVSIPSDYADRLTEIFPGSFEKLRLFVLDPYDIALSKIGRNSRRDRGDVRHIARTVNFDLNILRERYNDEVKPYLIGPPGREDLTLKLWIEMIEEERSQK